MTVVEGPQQHDAVNHPSHYTSDPSGVECITITRHRNFNVGNAIKYLWRAGLKLEQPMPVDGLPDRLVRQVSIERMVEDLEKARWYIADEIERLRGLKPDDVSLGLAKAAQIRTDVDEIHRRTKDDGTINSTHVAVEQTLRAQAGLPSYIAELDGPGNFIPTGDAA